MWRQSLRGIISNSTVSNSSDGIFPPELFPRLDYWPEGAGVYLLMQQKERAKKRSNDPDWVQTKIFTFMAQRNYQIYMNLGN
jgi:hypothetical protein